MYVLMQNKLRYRYSVRLRMQRSWQLLAVALMLGLSSPAAMAARLVVVPLASDSHILAFTVLTTELELLGDLEIYMVVSSTLSETAQRMASQRSPNHKHNYITYPCDFGVFADDMAKIAKSHPIFAMHYGYKVLTAMTEMVIGNTQLLHQIAQLKPDLIIGDASASYGHWLTAKLGIPSIEFDVGTSSGLLHAGGFGGQLNPAYIPASGTFYPSTGMTFYQRCSNVLHLFATKAMTYIHKNHGPIRSMARRQGVSFLPGQGPYKPLLLLVNFDWALEPARPVAPNTKYLGALMPRPPQQLPDLILEWLEGSSAASSTSDADSSLATAPDSLPVVYISFGASFLAPEAAMPALASAIAATRHKMRFLLRMRPQEHQLLLSALARLNITLTDEEVLVLPSVPQNDLLGHPAVAAFVTQGGYLSMQEAAYHAVPVIGIPLMLGHNELVSHAQDQGRGIVVRKEDLLAGKSDTLSAALLEVVTDNSYRQQAAITASRLKAHPQTPGQQATDWVHYALAAAPDHGSFLHTQGQDMGWWQVILLDVLISYAAVTWAMMQLLKQLFAWLRELGGAGRQAEAGNRAAGGDQQRKGKLE